MRNQILIVTAVIRRTMIFEIILCLIFLMKEGLAGSCSLPKPDEQINWDMVSFTDQGKHIGLHPTNRF